MSKFLHLLIFTTLTTLTLSVADIRIPLTYAFDFGRQNKLPIQLSFNHSYVYSSSPTSDLLLLNYSISVVVRSFLVPSNTPKV